MIAILKRYELYIAIIVKQGSNLFAKPLPRLSHELFVEGIVKISFLYNFSGVNIALRKVGAVVSSTSEITDEGNNKVRINTQSTFKSANVLFNVGGEIEEHTMDGRTCRVSENMITE